MKRWLGIVILLVLLAGFWLAYRHFYGGEIVRVTPIREGTVRAFIEEQAVTSLPRTYVLTMPFTGRLSPISFSPGESVKQGEVLARIDAQDLQLQLEQAEAEVARLEASIQENDDASLESISLKQATNFAAAMTETVKAAAAQMTSGREKLAVSTRTRERIEALYKSNAVSVDRLDQAQLDEVESNVQYEQDRLIYNASRAIETATGYLPTLVQQLIDNKILKHDVLTQQLRAAQSKLAEAKIQQQRGSISSPVDGVVLERKIDSEQTLPVGTELLRIGRLEDLQVEADVLTQEAVRIRVGDSVEIYGTALGPKPVSGKVQKVYPAGFTKISSLGVEQQRVKTIIQFAPDELAKIPPPRSLGVDYRVNVRIFTEEHTDTLWIPRTAAFRGPAGQWQTFAVRDRTLELVTLEVGLMNDQQLEVTKGLQSNDRVVTSPESHLEAGMRVQTEETSP